MTHKERSLNLRHKSFERFFLERDLSLIDEFLKDKHFISYLSDNLLLLKFHKIIDQSNHEIDNQLSSIIAGEKLRVKGMEDRIISISKYMNEKKINHIFTKAFQHYPDMGHDIDLLLEGSFESYDLKEKLLLQRDKTSFLNKIAEKKPFVTKENIAIEFHRFVGHFGEYKTLTNLFFELKTDLNGISILSRENQLILQLIQRFYSHFSVRFSDILLCIDLVNSDLDFDYIKNTSEKNDLKYPLEIFLNFLVENYSPYITNDFLKTDTRNPKLYPKYSDNLYRYKKIFTIKLYLKKIFSALMRHDLFALKKLLYIPIVFISTEFKYFKKVK